MGLAALLCRVMLPLVYCSGHRDLGQASGQAPVATGLLDCHLSSGSVITATQPVPSLWHFLLPFPQLRGPRATLVNSLPAKDTPAESSPGPLGHLPKPPWVAPAPSQPQYPLVPVQLAGFCAESVPGLSVVDHQEEPAHRPVTTWMIYRLRLVSSRPVPGSCQGLVEAFPPGSPRLPSEGGGSRGPRPAAVLSLTLNLPSLAARGGLRLR